METAMFEPIFMQMALLASVATGMSLGVLGVYLTIRRVVFFGLVLANAATLGAAVAEAIGWPQVSISIIAGIVAAAGLGEVGSSRRVSDESLMGWAYAAAAAATVLILSQAAGGNVDTLHLLFGNVLAIQTSHAIALMIEAAVVVVLHALFWRRFLLVTFDAEAAKVAGVKTRWWALAINLLIGAVAAGAVHEIGALSTFALLTLPAMAALLITSSVQATFIVAAALGVVVPSLALVASFYLDLPAGPACAAFLALSVAVAAIVSVGIEARKSLPRLERHPQADGPGLVTNGRFRHVDEDSPTL
jgi:ABC-type Mn2+/Zn2+ transport system permease subunit